MQANLVKLYDFLLFKTDLDIIKKIIDYLFNKRDKEGASLMKKEA